MNSAQLLRDGVTRLRSAGIQSPERDARRLLAYAAGVEPDRLIVMSTKPVSVAVRAVFEASIAERCKHKPISQIIGLRHFYKHEFCINGMTLDPRPETETLVDAALAQPFETVLDLGTGSGAILLSLLAEREGVLGVGVDISRDALAVARLNSARMNLQTRATFLAQDWFEGLSSQFDLIVANPPYISGAAYQHLAPDVRNWEPKIALTDDADGLTAYRRIVPDAPVFLTKGGRLVVEIGSDQGAAVSALFEENGFVRIVVHADLDGRDRVVSGFFLG